MIQIKVEQGRSTSTSEHSGQGISLTEVIAEALGYGSLTLNAVLVSFQNELETRFDVSYQLGSAGLFHATITMTREA